MRIYQCNDSWGRQLDYTFWVSDVFGTSWNQQYKNFDTDWCDKMLDITPLVFQQNVLENE